MFNMFKNVPIENYGMFQYAVILPYRNGSLGQWWRSWGMLFWLACLKMLLYISRNM